MTFHIAHASATRPFRINVTLIIGGDLYIVSSLTITAFAGLSQEASGTKLAQNFSR